MPKKALITGITGQDGSYMADLLLSKGYEVHGIVRRVASEREEDRYTRLAHLLSSKSIQLHHGDIVDPVAMRRIIAKVQPDELYHFAAQSTLGVSFEDESGTFLTNATAVEYILRALKDIAPHCHIFFAGTSEMFGKPEVSPQDETTLIRPLSPYGLAKTTAYHLIKMYREAHNLHASTGIFFAHESPRRGFDFVTRKISLAAVRIKNGRENELRLGDLDAEKDWGFAPDYVEAAWTMLQAKEPDDYVIGTGQPHTVRDFLNVMFPRVGLAWENHVVVDPAFVRPRPKVPAVSRPEKIKEKLGWKAQTPFETWVTMMIDSDLTRFGKVGI